MTSYRLFVFGGHKQRVMDGIKGNVEEEGFVFRLSANEFRSLSANQMVVYPFRSWLRRRETNRLCFRARE